MVAVTPIGGPDAKIEWPFLPPLDVGELRPLTPEDDLLGEMLDDSRHFDTEFYSKTSPF